MKSATSIRRFMTTVLVFVAAASADFSTDLLIISTGSWTVLNRDWEASYYNKLGLNGYFRIFDIKVHAGFPVAWTVEKEKERIFPGDFSFYTGKKIGRFEPRLGAVFPLGYGIDDNWKKDAWIGTNNIRLRAGVGIGATETDLVDGLRVGGEIMTTVALTGGNTHARPGSVGGYATAKTSVQLSDPFRLGLELPLYFGAARWQWTFVNDDGENENVNEYSGTFLPALYGEYHFGGMVYAGFKAGFGPSVKYSNENPEWSYTGNSTAYSVGLHLYP